MKKFLNILWYGFIFIFIICVCYIMYSRFFLKKPNINIFGYSMYMILTGSMETEIYPYDLVIIKDTDNIEKGDIIAYREENSVIVHRVVASQKDPNGEIQYETKGDNNNASDELLITQDRVIGKKVGKIPKVGKVVYSVFHAPNLVLLIVVTIIVIIILIRYIRNTKFIKKKSEDKEKKE